MFIRVTVKGVELEMALAEPDSGGVRGPPPRLEQEQDGNLEL